MRRVGSVQLTPKLYRATIDGERREDISAIVRSGKVTYDQDRETQMSFACVVSDPSAVEPYQDFLAPELTLTYPDGHVVTEPLGLYAVAPPRRDASPQQTKGTLDGRDLGWILSSATVASPYTIAAGSNCMDAVAALIASVGITRYSLPATAHVFDADTTWPPGTRKLRIASDILGGIGMYVLYMRRDGWLTTMPRRTLIEAEPAVRYATPAESYVRVVRSQILEPDVSRIYNTITVMRDDPTKATIYATAINDDPESPVSTTSTGLALAPPEPIRVQTLSSQTEADALARSLLEEAAAVYTKLTLTTSPDPSRNPHEVYELAVSNAAGDVAAGKWWCSGWQIGFTPADGPMIHELNKLVPFGEVVE
jgi:hypothetical protein